MNNITTLSLSLTAKVVMRVSGGYMLTAFSLVTDSLQLDGIASEDP